MKAAGSIDASSLRPPPVLIDAGRRSVTRRPSVRRLDRPDCTSIDQNPHPPHRPLRVLGGVHRSGRKDHIGHKRPEVGVGA